jgi:Tfp pilus assembly protein PilO
MNKFLIPSILIIISLGLFFLYIDPVYTETKKIKEEKNLYDEALNKSKELRQIRDELLNKYNSFSEENLVRLKKMIPDSVDNVRLIMDIDNIASGRGITISAIDVGIDNGSDSRIGSDTGEDYDFVTLDIDLLASYDDFIGFIGDLKDSLRLVDIPNISFVVPDPYLNIYKYNITIKTYWLK